MFKVKRRVRFNLVNQRLEILEFLSSMDIVAHDTVEKVEVKHLVLLVRLKYKHATLGR